MKFTLDFIENINSYEVIIDGPRGFHRHLVSPTFSSEYSRGISIENFIHEFSRIFRDQIAPQPSSRFKISEVNGEVVAMFQPN